jgi:hypothetical protein
MQKKKKPKHVTIAITTVSSYCKPGSKFTCEITGPITQQMQGVRMVIPQLEKKHFPISGNV